MPAPYSKLHLEIRTLKHLAYRLGINLSELEEISRSIDECYNERKRRKKDGDFRTLSVPIPWLKKIQGRIHRLLREVNIHDAAHCGIKGRSNRTNAEQHCGKRTLLNLDFKKFFDNISHHQVYYMFRHYLMCSPQVASLLTRLSTFTGGVPQGGPMSTDIANLVCCQLDLRLSGLSKKYDLTYTRYCDDLSFSGKNIPDSFVKTAKEIIRQSGFRLKNKENTEKRCTKDRPQIVTGLSVAGSSPKVPRSIKKAWQKEAYIFEKHEGHQLPKDLHRKKMRRIEGRKAYLRYIEQGTELIPAVEVGHKVEPNTLGLGEVWTDRQEHGEEDRQGSQSGINLLIDQENCAQNCARLYLNFSKSLG